MALRLFAPRLSQSIKPSRFRSSPLQPASAIIARSVPSGKESLKAWYATTTRASVRMLVNAMTASHALEYKSLRFKRAHKVSG